MRSGLVAGLGGLVIGHILWLIGIKFATDSSDVSGSVLVVVAISFGVAVVAGLLGWLYQRRKATAKAAFLWCLTISPVLFSIALLGVTYL